MKSFFLNVTSGPLSLGAVEHVHSVVHGLHLDGVDGVWGQGADGADESVAAELREGGLVPQVVWSGGDLVGAGACEATPAHCYAFGCDREDGQSQV